MSKDIPPSPDEGTAHSPDLLKPALLGDQVWSPDILQNELSALAVKDTVVHETMRILDMWNAVEYSMSKLTLAEKAGLESRFPSDILQFGGFDATADRPHYLVSGVLVVNLPRFYAFLNRHLNKSGGNLERYRAMYALFAEMQINEEHPLLSADKLDSLFCVGL